MPIWINPPKPEEGNKLPSISVVLGYKDVGIGQVDEENYKGIGFVQLSKPYKKGEIPHEQQQEEMNGDQAFKVFLLVRNKAGIAVLRKAVAQCEKALLGKSSRTLGDNLTDAFMEEIGEKEVEIERLKYDLAEANKRIVALESST